jgi:hypothetical protein
VTPAVVGSSKTEEVVEVVEVGHDVVPQILV